LGPLSIKAFFSGTARYSAGGGEFAVDRDRYLVLNHGQEYTISVDSPMPVESFCIFFEAGFTERVHASLTVPAARLVDDPEVRSSSSVNFYERTYRHDDLVSPALLHLRSRRPERFGDPLWLEEQLDALMVRLLQAHRALDREVERIPAARAATRQELYRRAHLARDYAAALFDRPITLEDMARAASLSPNHLLRAFRSVFGQTPHQFVVERRLEQARALLGQTDMPVTEVCFAVGLRSPGSFSALFRRRTGMGPEKYRCRFG
jgi:AraC-like DNA-binding protein